MGIRDYYCVANITNATNGDIIDTIRIRNYSYETIVKMLSDIISHDIANDKHGILVKYGIEQ